MKKFLTLFAIFAVMFSAVVLAEGRQQPGSQGDYNGGADSNFLGNYKSNVLNGFAYALPILDSEREAFKKSQAKVLKGEKQLSNGNSVSAVDNSLSVSVQAEDSDSVTFLVKVAKNRKPVVPITLGNLFLAVKEGKLVLVTGVPKGYTSNFETKAVVNAEKAVENKDAAKAVTPSATASTPVVPANK